MRIPGKMRLYKIGANSIASAGSNANGIVPTQENNLKGNFKSLRVLYLIRKFIGSVLKFF